MKLIQRSTPHGRRLLSAALCAVLMLGLAGGAEAATDAGLRIEDGILGGDALTQTVLQAVSVTADSGNSGIGVDLRSNNDPVTVAVTGGVDARSDVTTTGIRGVAVPGGTLDLTVSGGVAASGGSDAAYGVCLKTESNSISLLYYEDGGRQIPLLNTGYPAFRAAVAASDDSDMTADYETPRVFVKACTDGTYDLYLVKDDGDVVAWGKEPLTAEAVDTLYGSMTGTGTTQAPTSIPVTLCTQQDPAGTARALSLAAGELTGPAVFCDVLGGYFLAVNSAAMQIRRIAADNAGEVVTCAEFGEPRLRASLGGEIAAAEATENIALDLKAYGGPVAAALESGVQLTAAGGDYAWGVLADAIKALSISGQNISVSASAGGAGANSSAIGLFLRVVNNGYGAISRASAVAPSELRLTGRNSIRVSASGTPKTGDYSAGILVNCGAGGMGSVYYEGNIEAAGVGMVGVEAISLLGGQPIVTVLGDLTLTGSDSDGVYVTVPKPRVIPALGINYQPKGEVYVRGNVALTGAIGDDASGVSAIGGVVVVDGDVSVSGSSDQLLGIYADQDAAVLVTGTVTAPVAVLIPSDVSASNVNTSKVYVWNLNGAAQGKTDQLGYVLKLADGLTATLSSESEAFYSVEKEGKTYYGAAAGDTVTVTTSQPITVTDAHGTPVAVTVANGGYTFTVPADCGVTIAAQPYIPYEEPEPATTTTTTENPDGSITETVVAADGSKAETTTTADGSTGTVKTDADGSAVSAEAAPSQAAVDEAAASGEPVTLPVEVAAADSAEDAVPIAITLPETAERVTVEIPVENLTPGTVAVLVHADGTEEIIKTSVTSENGVVLTLDGSATVKIVDNTKVLADVDADAWYADAAAWAASREIMVGTGAGFAPETDTNRGMFAQLLFNLDGAQPSGEIAPFEDVAAGDWYADSVTWLVENGIAQGKGDTFDPNGPVTREQVAVMLYNYAKYKGYDVGAVGDLSAFTDADSVSDWADAAMRWAVGAGLINGMGDGTVDPQGFATRAQVAALMQRFCALVAQ